MVKNNKKRKPMMFFKFNNVHFISLICMMKILKNRTFYDK